MHQARPEPSDLRWLCRRSVCRKNRHDRSGQNRNNPVLHVAPLEPLGIPLMKRDQGDQERIFEADFHSGQGRVMSASGTLQTSMPTMNMSASGGKADIPDPLCNVC